MGDVPSDVQGVLDAALSCASLLGIPPVTLGAEGAKLLIDLGFAHFLHATEGALRARVAGQTAGQAAGASQAATRAQERTLRAMALVLAHHHKIVEQQRPDLLADVHACCACMGWTEATPGYPGPTWEEHVTVVTRQALGGIA